MPIDPGFRGSVAGQPWGLPQAWSLVRRGSGAPDPATVVLLPSYSVAHSLLNHYADRLLMLEHRHLLHLLALRRAPARMVFVTSARPRAEVVDYYLSFLPSRRRHDVRSRLHFLEVPDPSVRSVTAKLLDRPDLVAELRGLVGGAPAYIEPWNVTWDELRLAELLELPLNGTPPALWQLGFKSNGRRILRAAGVPVPVGREDVRSVDGVVAAVEGIRRDRPAANGVVVKTDNSGVVTGQRLMQASGDIFLGWNHLEGVDGIDRDFYVRQLKDMKGSASVETMDPTLMRNHAQLCAWTLARAHARAGDAIAISTYLGESDDFPKAAARFAERYADRNEKDHALFSEALTDGRLAGVTSGSPPAITKVGGEQGGPRG